MPVLAPLHRAAGLVRLQVATYQAVSGSGGAGVAELDGQVRAVVDRAADAGVRRPCGRRSPRPAASTSSRSPSTCCRWPARSSTTARGETDEEQKLRNESRKILHLPDLLVAGTCVRVPVFTGHSLAVHAEFADDLSPEQATALLAEAPGVELMDVPDPARRRRQRPELRRPDPGRPVGAGRARAWCCSSPTTTCARVPPSTRCRSPRSSPPARLAVGRSEAVTQTAPRRRPAAQSTLAMLGAGVMGETVLSGLVRAGWDPADHRGHRPAARRARPSSRPRTGSP